MATEEELEYERALAMLKADRDAWEADCLALQTQNGELLAALEDTLALIDADVAFAKSEARPELAQMIQQLGTPARAAIAARGEAK